MPTRKQRRRAAKEKRHEYETVWVDAEGNELDEPPDDEAATDGRSSRAVVSKAKEPAKGKTQPQRGRGGARVPPAPSWERAGKRALMLGVVVFALFYLTGGRSGNRLLGALGLAALYTALFVPFTYAIDRFAYQRWQRRQQGGGKPPTKKR
jgi:hypothetical protein